MAILAMDTCLGACSVALLSEDGRGESACVSRIERMDKGHAERLIPMIGEVMAAAPLGFDGIGLIGVTEGPGTFTGVRIGIAAARALSLATGAPIATMSSLELLARTVALNLPTAGHEIAVAVGARRDEIYFQLFDGNDFASLTEPLLLLPGDAAKLLGARTTLFIGSGAELLSEAAGRLLGAAGTVVADVQPDARCLAEGVRQRRVGAKGRPAPRPLYLRPPDAKPQDGMSLARVP